MLSSVFCSRMSCGCTSMLKRREISNSRSRMRAEGDVLQRLVEDRLAHGAHRGFHLVDARAGRHPARLDVQHGDAPVIAIEHREEILGEVVLVARIERADDAEVDRRIARIGRIVDEHEDVAGVHVGVEEVVAEHLREEDLHAVLGELADVRAGRAQPRHVADGHAVDALHHHHVHAAVVPVHLGDVEQVASPRNCASVARRWPLRASGPARRARSSRTRATTSSGRSRRLSLQYASASPASAYSTSRSRWITSRMSGRSTLTTTSLPSFSRAACTCAIEAAASGCSSNCANTSVTGLPYASSTICRATRAVERRHAVLELHQLVRRCRRAAGRAASTPPDRTSRRSAPAPRARAASARRGSRGGGARTIRRA